MNYSPQTTAQLIQAITDANNYAGPHTITLRTGFVYLFNTPNTPISISDGPVALPKLLQNITFAGNGAILRRSLNSAEFRLLLVGNGVSVNLNDLTIENGQVSGTSAVGGGILNYGTLTLTRCTVQNNIAVGTIANPSYGGGIENAFVSGTSASLTVNDSIFSRNRAGTGGAIHNQGVVTVTFSQMNGNVATSGACVEQLGNTTMTVIDSIISDNTGGAFFSRGAATITNCIISNNAAAYDPVISTDPYSSMTISNCRIFENTSFSVVMDGSVTINAPNNWWGAPTGPSGQGPGTGDSVGFNVNYAPFLYKNEPISTCRSCVAAYQVADALTTANPVSLQYGDKRLEVSDLELNTPSGTLAFKRYFQQKQQTNSQYQFMGLGWTHEHAVRLVLSGTAPSQTVIVYLAGGILELKQQSSQPTKFLASAGSTASMDYNAAGHIYTLTLSDKSRYIFNDASFNLISINRANNETWTYNYVSSGLSQVDDGYGRQLNFSYISNPGGFDHGKLWRVGDQTAANLSGTTPTGKYVEFSYVPERNNGVTVSNAKALLSTVRDTRSNLWTYVYHGQQVGEATTALLNYMLQRVSPSVDTTGDGAVDNPVTLERLTYTLSGSTIGGLKQERGVVGTATALLDSTLTFQPSGKNATYVTIAGRTTQYLFESGIYTGTKDPAGNVSYERSNLQFRTAAHVDANKNLTQFVWSSDAKFLNRVVDAAGNTTAFKYNTDETLQSSQDAQGHITQYTYGDASNSRLPTIIKIIDPNGTTVLQWQKISYDLKGRTLSEQMLDPANGTTIQQEVTRTYYGTGSGAGLLQTITQRDIGGSSDQATTYTYDTAGRVAKTQKNSTFGDCNITFTVYDPAGNVVAAICNYNPGANPDPATVAQAVALFNPALPDTNRVTTYGYDTLGRRIQTTTNAGASYAQVMLTVYDALDRVSRTITNYVANVAILNPYTAAQSAFTHGSDNTQNLVTDTFYNERGMVRKQADVLGNVTLFGYDAAGRLIKTVANASQPLYDVTYMVGDPALNMYPISSAADSDLVQTSQYDAVGNLIQTTDALGRITITVYDALNRPIKVVRNPKASATLTLNSGDLGYDASNDPRSTSYVPDPSPDRDQIDQTEYDMLGRVKRSQDALGSWTLYGYDALGRQVRTVRNASMPGYDQITDPALASYPITGAADQDLATDATYDVNGRMLYTVNLNGEKTWAAYDGLGRTVKTISNAVGTATNGGTTDPRSPTYVESSSPDRDLVSRTQYDLSGRVQWTSDLLGRKTWQVYDTLGRVVKVIQNCTYTTGLPAPEDATYVGQHGTNTALDVITRTTYDVQGRVSKTIDALSNETRYTYDVLGRQSTTIRNYQDGLYNTAVPDEDLTETVNYDLAGRVTRKVDNAGNETRFEYDAAGRSTKVIQNYQDGMYSSAQPDRDLISLTTYNKAGQVLTTTDVRQTVTTFSYDLSGRQTLLTQAAGSTLETKSYTCYDKGGRVRRLIQNYRPGATDPAPDATDTNGVYQLMPVSHGVAEDTNLVFPSTLDALGRTVQRQDALGITTGMTYNKAGQIMTTTDPIGVVIAYRYDRAQRRVRVVQGYVPGTLSDPGIWAWDDAVGQKKWKDGSGNVIPFGSNNDQNVIAEASYDKAGRMTALRDPRGNRTAYTYDLLDRRTALTNPLNQTWATAFSELTGTQRTTLTDPLNTATQQTTDKLGRIASLVYVNETPKLTPDVTFTYDAAGNRTRMNETNGATPVRITTYSYDAARRLTGYGLDRDGNGTVDELVSYEYDAGGLRTKLTLPGALAVTYTYNPAGQLVSLTDWSNQATQLRYDAVGRLISTEQASGLQRQARYDAAGRLKRLSHRVNNRTLGDYRYTIDARGNRTQVAEAIPKVGTGATTYAYNDLALLVTPGVWTDSAPFKTSPNFSATLQLAFAGRGDATLRMGTGPDHSTYDLYLNGDLWQTVNGYTATSSEAVFILPLRDDGPHLLEVRNRSEKDPRSSGYIVRFKSLTTAVTAQTFELRMLKYTYDALSRLLVTDAFSGQNVIGQTLRREVFGYDVTSNRTQQQLTLGAGATTTTAYTYDAVNRLTTVGAATLVYDAAGRMTSDGVKAYTWDRANRMLSMGTVSAQYNGAGQRIAQTVSGVVTQYLLDVQAGLYQVLASTTTTNTTRYVHGPTGIHAQQNPGSAWVTPLQDGLGSVRGVVDSSLVPLESRQYSSYGEVSGTTGTNQASFGYTGEPTDANGLIYLRARYYNPALGVFPSLDPLEGDMGNPGSLNRFAYVRGNPINAVDPSGMQPDLAPFCLGANVQSQEVPFNYSRLAAARAAWNLSASGPSKLVATIPAYSAMFISLSLYAGGFPMTKAGPNPQDGALGVQRGWRASVKNGLIYANSVWQNHNNIGSYDPSTDTRLIGYVFGSTDARPTSGFRTSGGGKQTRFEVSLLGGGNSVDATQLNNSLIKLNSVLHGDYVFIDSRNTVNSDTSNTHGYIVVGKGPALTCKDAEEQTLVLNGDKVQAPNSNPLTFIGGIQDGIPYVADWSGQSTRKTRPFYCSRSEFNHTYWNFITVPENIYVAANVLYGDAGFSITPDGQINIRRT